MDKTNEIIDSLNRDNCVEQIKQLIITLDSSKTNRSFAINGKWGCGKSFVLDMLETTFINSENYILFKFNAWEYDFYEEPLIAILSSIIDRLNILLNSDNIKKNIKEETIKFCISNLSKLLSNLTKYTIGFDVVNGAKAIAKKAKEIMNNSLIKNDFDSSQVLKNAITKIRNNLLKLNKKIIFIVDEIDRCLPDYAIKILERTHHIFNKLSNSINIYSIDKTQLKHLISNYYGSNLDIDSYMEKFIEFTYDIDNGIFNDKFKEIFKNYLSNFETDNIDLLNKFQEDSQYLMQYLPMRKRIQVVKKAELLHNLLINKKCDLTILYFEIFCLIIFDIYKEQCNSFLYNSFTPKDHSMIKGHAEKCFNRICGAANYYTDQFQHNNEHVKIQNLNDISSIMFLYIKKISKYDINCTIDVPEHEYNFVENKLKTNVEYVRKFYNNMLIIH